MKKLLFLSVPLMLLGTITLTNKVTDTNSADFEKPAVREVTVERPNGRVLAPRYAQQPTMNGSGTAANPYIITSTAQFAQIQYDLTAYYKLGKNINFNSTTINPIPGTFQGELDGDGKTISNFKISRNYTTNVSFENLGLFDTIGSTGRISNLIVNDSTVEAKQSSTNSTLVYGGLICGMNYGSISYVKCYRSKVSIENKFGLAGGISGYSNGSITACYVCGCKVFGADVVGGISGSVDNNSTTLACSLNNAPVFFGLGGWDSCIKLIVKNVTNSFCAGGIAGYCFGNAVIDSCFLKNTKFQIQGTLNKSPAMGYVVGHMNYGYLYYPETFFEGNTKANINSAYTSYYFANYDGYVGKREGNPYVVNTSPRTY